MAAPARTNALPPPEFGRDGGEFYRHYDKIADQLDNKLVKGLKASLDGLLIFVSFCRLISTGVILADRSALDQPEGRAFRRY